MNRETEYMNRETEPHVQSETNRQLMPWRHVRAVTATFIASLAFAGAGKAENYIASDQPVSNSGHEIFNIGLLPVAEQSPLSAFSGTIKENSTDLAQQTGQPVSLNIGENFHGRPVTAKVFGSTDTRSLATTWGSALSRMGYRNSNKLSGMPAYNLLAQLPNTSVVTIFDHANAGSILTGGESTKLCNDEGLLGNTEPMGMCNDRFLSLGVLQPSNALENVKLLILGGCNTADDSPYKPPYSAGNLMKTAAKLGVRAVIAFKGVIDSPNPSNPNHGPINLFWNTFARDTELGHTLSQSYHHALRGLIRKYHQAFGLNTLVFGGALAHPGNEKLTLPRFHTTNQPETVVPNEAPGGKRIKDRLPPYPPYGDHHTPMSRHDWSQQIIFNVCSKKINCRKECKKFVASSRGQSYAVSVLSKSGDTAYKPPWNGLGFQAHHIVPKGNPYNIACFSEAILQHEGVAPENPANLVGLRGTARQVGTAGYNQLTPDLQRRAAHADTLPKYYYQSINQAFAYWIAGHNKRLPSESQSIGILNGVKSTLLDGGKGYITPGPRR